MAVVRTLLRLELGRLLALVRKRRAVGKDKAGIVISSDWSDQISGLFQGYHTDHLDPRSAKPVGFTVLCTTYRH